MVHKNSNNNNNNNIDSLNKMETPISNKTEGRYSKINAGFSCGPNNGDKDLHVLNQNLNSRVKTFIGITITFTLLNTVFLLLTMGFVIAIWAKLP